MGNVSVVYLIPALPSVPTPLIKSLISVSEGSLYPEVMSTIWLSIYLTIEIELLLLFVLVLTCDSASTVLRVNDLRHAGRIGGCSELSPGSIGVY